MSLAIAALGIISLAAASGLPLFERASPLPLLGQAQRYAACETQADENNELFCIVVPRSAARETAELYRAELERQGWMVGPAPEVFLGFVKMKSGEPCDGGTLVVYGEVRADMEAAQAVFMFSFGRNNTCETAE